MRHKAISSLHFGPGVEYNYPVLKKVSGQGLLYTKVKQGYEFVHDSSLEIDGDAAEATDDESCIQDAEVSPQAAPEGSSKSTTNIQETSLAADVDLGAVNVSSGCNKSEHLVSEIQKQGLSEPVKILRFLQKKLVHGRELDVKDSSEENEGQTNYVCADRNDILSLKTTFTELEPVQDFNITQPFYALIASGGTSNKTVAPLPPISNHLITN